MKNHEAYEKLGFLSRFMTGCPTTNVDQPRRKRRKKKGKSKITDR